MAKKADIENIVEKAIKIIKAGGLVAFPTDTVYCLGADAGNSEAIAKIYNVKHRPRNMALPVIVANMNQLFKVCQVSPLALFLANEFFPKGFTLVMPKLPVLPDIITAGKNTVAVRIQDNPIASRIAEALELGVVGTSANIHQLESPVTALQVKKQLGEKVDIIIEGSCSGGVESTIVDVTSDKPVILRNGAVPYKKIEAAWERFRKRE